jgi:hypothetical protein
VGCFRTGSGGTELGEGRAERVSGVILSFRSVCKAEKKEREAYFARKLK